MYSNLLLLLKNKKMKIRKNIAISDSGFVFNPSSGDSYTVNEIGMYIIKLMKENINIEEIVDKVSEEYVCDKTTVEKDVYDFMKLIESYKLNENEEQ